MSKPAADDSVAEGVDVGAFKTAMRQLPGGVTVITAGRDGDISGMTVSSFVSLSVDPPTVLVSISRSSSSWPLIQMRGVFGANILAADQTLLADRFSGKGGLSGPERFGHDDGITDVGGEGRARLLERPVCTDRSGWRTRRAAAAARTRRHCRGVAVRPYEAFARLSSGEST